MAAQLPTVAESGRQGRTIVDQESCSEGDRESGTRLDPMLGALVGGKYRIDRLLADGGMGRVYVATQESLRRSVALKVVRHDDDTSAGHEAQRRFHLEAAILARLRHPNIVTLYDFGDMEGMFTGSSYLAMELLEGQSLAARIDAAARLPLSEVLAITEQIVRGLRFAHGNGVMHRDMKPANIMLLPDDADSQGPGALKIVDFGTSKLVHAEGPPGANRRLTQEGFVVGTPEYMAPEQLEGDPCPASDVFAVGVIMFEALTGALPFDFKGKLRWRPPSPRLREVAPDLDVPQSVEDLVARLLEAAPDARPKPTELLEELRRCALELAPGGPAAASARPRSAAPLPLLPLPLTFRLRAALGKRRVALGAGAFGCALGALLVMATGAAGGDAGGPTTGSGALRLAESLPRHYVSRVRDKQAPAPESPAEMHAESPHAELPQAAPQTEPPPAPAQGEPPRASTSRRDAPPPPPPPGAPPRPTSPPPPPPPPDVRVAPRATAPSPTTPVRTVFSVIDTER